MNKFPLFFWVLTALVSIYTTYALAVASLTFINSEHGADPAPYSGYLLIAVIGWIIVAVIFLLLRGRKEINF